LAGRRQGNRILDNVVIGKVLDLLVFVFWVKSEIENQKSEILLA
jgi:hypothetical protein